MQAIVAHAISILKGLGLDTGDVKVFKFPHPHVHCASKE